jgi:hypothetical protein
VREAAPHQLLRREPLGGLAVEGDAPGLELAVLKRQQARDGLQRGRLAGAVAAQKRHQLGFAHAQRHALQHMALAVVRVQALDLEDVAGAHALPPVIMLPR